MGFAISLLVCACSHVMLIIAFHVTCSATTDILEQYIERISILTGKPKIIDRLVQRVVDLNSTVAKSNTKGNK